MEARVFWTRTALAMRGGGAGWEAEVGQVVGQSADALDVGGEGAQFHSDC